MLNRLAGNISNLEKSFIGFGGIAILRVGAFDGVVEAQDQLRLSTGKMRIPNLDNKKK